MISKKEYDSAVAETLAAFAAAGIAVTQEEKAKIEVADFGLGELRRTGLQLLTYINTDRVCAKEMALFAGQTCPEHLHPQIDGRPGKEETFRCRAGSVYLYVGGEPTENIKAELPSGKVTVFHEVVLGPGEQYTIFPGTLHWFQGGPEGAIVSEFSTRSRDESDIFTDERIVRAPEIGK